MSFSQNTKYTQLKILLKIIHSEYFDCFREYFCVESFLMNYDMIDKKILSLGCNSHVVLLGIVNSPLSCRPIHRLTLVIRVPRIPKQQILLFHTCLGPTLAPFFLVQNYFQRYHLGRYIWRRALAVPNCFEKFFIEGASKEKTKLLV